MLLRYIINIWKVYSHEYTFVFEVFLSPLFRDPKNDSHLKQKYDHSFLTNSYEISNEIFFVIFGDIITENWKEEL